MGSDTTGPIPSSMDESCLVWSVQRGEPGAFRTFVERYGLYLRWMITRTFVVTLIQELLGWKRYDPRCPHRARLPGNLSTRSPLRLPFWREARSEDHGVLQERQVFSVQSRRLLQGQRSGRQSVCNFQSCGPFNPCSCCRYCRRSGHDLAALGQVFTSGGSPTPRFASRPLPQPPASDLVP
jgi:hypothetical protein